MTPTGATAAGGIESLPSFRFRTAFRNYEPSVRAATLVAGIVVPAVCIGLFLWLLPRRDLFDDRLLWFLLIIAVVTPVVFLTSHGVPHTVTLTPAAIEYRELRPKGRIPTRDVSLIASIAHPRRVIFAVLGRGGESVVFGPGLSTAELDSVRDWLQSLASSLGIEFRENIPLAEAMAIFARMGK